MQHVIMVVHVTMLYSSLISASCSAAITVTRCVELDQNEPLSWLNDTKQSKLHLKLLILRYSPFLDTP